MRKTNLLLLTTALTLGSLATGSLAAENKTKMRTDEYLIIDLAKVTEDWEEESIAAEAAFTENTLTDFYLNLSDTENTGDYEVKGTLAGEPIIAQFLAQNEAFSGFDAVGVYEITGNTTDDLDTYELNLVLADDAKIYHYSQTDGVLMSTPLEALFGAEQAHTVSMTSSSNHWIVVHLKAAEQEERTVTVETAAGSLEGQVETADTGAESSASVETSKETENVTTKTPETTKTQSTTKIPETTKVQNTTKAPEMTVPATTKTPETTKAPETKPSTKPTTPTTSAPTKAPETTAPTTTAPTTTAHTHTWVPVTTIVHHDAVTSQVWKEDSAAWDETVVTKAAWDEQVLVTAAWDENVVTKEAWDEQVLVTAAWDEPIYALVEICNACGHEFLDPNEDVGAHMSAGCWSSWHGEQRQVGTTHHDAVYSTVHHDAETTTVHHDAVYTTVHHDAETTVVHHEATGHYETVVTQAAWDEDVVTGYKCSGCGATK